MLVFIELIFKNMKYINNILIVLFFSFVLPQEEWNMTINVDDIQGIGASDQITLGMCQNCSDEFRFGEDQYDIPPPPGYHTDISFFNFDWLGTVDSNGNVCDNPEFYIDKKSFHEPVDLLIWEIGGLTNLVDNLNNDDNLELSWSMEDLDDDYEVFLYIGNSSYNMRNINNAIITEEQLLVDYNSVSGEFNPNIRIVIGGCAESGDISDYYYDQDEDGLGAGASTEFCTGKAPEGWVLNNDDVDDQVYCLSNVIDACNQCDGENLCVGCADVNACNYSSLVTIDDGSCYYIEEYYDCNGDCLVDSDGDDVCDELEILGCTDPNACNYNLDATDDDGCEYPLDYFDCNGNCLIDSDGDDVCDELEILGCTNPLSCLFDSNATEHDGSCCGQDDLSCIEPPGEISILDIEVSLNSATIDWEQPCGISSIWVYRLLQDLDDVGTVIPSPFTIEELDWGTSYSFYLKTINTAGVSITEINFDTEDQPLPEDILGLAYQSAEAEILLNWEPSLNSSAYNILKDGQIIDTVDGGVASYLDSDVYYDSAISYGYAIQGVNAQGYVGNASPTVYAQADPVPVPVNLDSSANPGSIDFSWEIPDAYASIADYSFELYQDGNIVEANYNDLIYTISNLNFDEEVCFGVRSIHQFGKSDIELICAYPDMPYPPSISDLTAAGAEGYVSIAWTMLQEPNHFINIYRDGQLIALNVNTLESPAPYINDIDDGFGMLANQSYSYQISALNSDLIEGPISEPVIATTFALPIVLDLSAQAGDGRVLLNWSSLDSYGGDGYSYEIIDQNNNVVFETTDLYATISNLIGGEEYCFRIRANSLGGYGVSDESNQACAVPQVAFDGTEGDNNIDWGIQLSLNLALPGGDLLLDTQNMLGVASDATDGCDSTYDIAELTDTPNDWAKLHFPHQGWDCALVPGSKYNNDIRSEYLDASEVKEWAVQLETNSWSDGIATVSFHFYEQAGGNTAYYTSDDINYIKINDGDQIEYGLVNPVLPGSFKVIVGNIVPEAPINIGSNPGYREVELSWFDGYVAGSLSYESTSYNIYRNGELIGNTSESFFIDRGLEFSTEYHYEISGLNIAGEGLKSDIVSSTTLENRPPVPNAGIDLIIYDFNDDDIENGLFTLPMNINDQDPSNGSILLIENMSFDFDNYSDIGVYEPPLDQLSYLWESSSNNNSTEDIYEVQSDGYGMKTFSLQVDDGFLNSDYKDSVNVDIKPMPAPARVYVDTSYAGLYSIELHWLESNYTGEPYIKSNINSGILVFEDGDFFEDVNGNGVYDSGLDPLPPFYGLSNLNNAFGFKNIADYYKVEVNGLSLGNVSQPCIANPEDLILDEYCYVIGDLEPSSEYSIVVKSCNFNDECSDSDTLIVSTGHRPYVEVLYPNGAEIIGVDEPMAIELDFGSGARYIDSLYLSILVNEFSLWDTTIFTSTTQNMIDDNYVLSINSLEYNSTLNSNSKIEVRIVDEGGVGSSVNSNYYDDSDNLFIIANNNVDKDFDEGWHLIGTPVVLDSSISMQSHVNNGIDFNYNIYWQIVDEDETVTDPISPSDQIFNSGEGYYLNLYSGSPVDQVFTQNINLSGDVVTNYTIDNLSAGWNLISNPLVISMNLNNLSIVDGENVMNWEEANEAGLVAPYLLELDHDSNTLIPSYEVEPYKGYWLYLYRDIDIEFKSKVQIEDDLDSVVSDTDFIINLYSNAFGQSSSVFGDFIQLGYAVDASNEFSDGFDIPNLDYQYFSQYTSMHIQNSDENSLYTELSRDIREHYQPSYVWNIEGVSQAIYDPLVNPDSEVELFWDISAIDSNYVVLLEYGLDFSNQTNMREFNYVKLNDSQFSNMRIVVELQNYLSGCPDSNACNYFCNERPWECPEGSLPANFIDDSSCDLMSCVGCMDISASNYNPNAAIDSVCDGGVNDGLNCMDDPNVCGTEGVCVQYICEFNESYLFQSDSQVVYVENNLSNKIPIYLTNYNSIPVYGVEIELAFDPSVIDISSVLPTDLSNANSIIQGYSSLSYVDSDEGVFYFIAYPINNNIAFDGGVLFDLEIHALGLEGDTTSIVFNKSVLNDTDILSDDLELLLSQGSIEFSGNTGYYSNINVPIESVELDLIGYSQYNNPYDFVAVDTLSAFSSFSGDYIFDSALKGNYIMQASKFESAGSDQGLSAVDASRIARYLINLIEFNEDQMLAADVDMSGTISAVDAAFVARYLIGLTDQLNDQGQHWRFRSADDFYLNIIDSSGFNLNLYDLRPLDNNLNNQDIVGIRIGDVDGSWISDVQARDVTSFNQMDMFADSNQLLSVPLGFSNQQLVEGIEVKISYDGQELSFDNFELQNKFENYNIIINDSNSGELSMIIYAAYDIENSEDVFGTIAFQIMNDDLSDSVIEIEKFLVNGQDLYSGFQVFDDYNSKYVYSKILNVSAQPYPTTFSLGECYPNPFNPITQIPFSLPVESSVDIVVYDISGRLVDTILSRNLSPGNHMAEFNGQYLSSGVYIIKVHAKSLNSNENFIQSNKVLLLK